MVHGLLGRADGGSGGGSRGGSGGGSRGDAGDARGIGGYLPRLALSAFLAMGVMVASLALYGMEGQMDGEAALAMRGVFRMGALLLALPVFLLLWLPMLDAVCRFGTWFSADGLILVSTGAALAVSMWNTFGSGDPLAKTDAVYYDTATMVLVLVGLGKWLDTRARERAAQGLRVLGREEPAPAHRHAPDSAAHAAHMEDVDPARLDVGDLVRVRTGEAIPVDGRVRSGGGLVDEAHITGEESPRSCAPGDVVWAGTWLQDGMLDVEAEAVAGSRLADRIEALLLDARQRRAPLVRLADRMSAGLFPLALGLALLTLLVNGPAFGLERALLSALSVVLIACPCALGLATPLAFWVALGEAWRRGALVRSGAVLERLGRVRRVLLDKTGTLTEGRLELLRVQALGECSEERALALALALEEGSEHPIARGLRAAGEARGVAAPAASELRHVAGRGVRGRLAGRQLELCAEGPPDEVGAAAEEASTRVWLWDRDRERALACFHLAAVLRAGAEPLVTELARRGLEPRVLTGDAAGPAERLHRRLGVPVESQLLPTHKAERVAAAGAGTLFVGDGLNDAPALASADVSIAVRGAAPRTLESASVALLKDDLTLIPDVIDLARRAVGVARFNLLWAFAYNGVGLYLAFQGRLSPVFAAVAMVVSSLVVVLNSSRLARRSPRSSTAATRQFEASPCPSDRNETASSTGWHPSAPGSTATP